MSRKQKETRYIVWTLIKTRSSPQRRYAVALLVSVLALELAGWLGHGMEQNSSPLFLVAVMVSTWYGGLGPGLVTTVLTAVSVDYYLSRSASAFLLDLNSALRLGSFALAALVITFLTSSRQRAEKTLRKQREWLRTTVLSIGDGVIVTDAQGCVTFMNPVAQSLTGWKGEEAIGKSLAEVFKIVNEKACATVENPVTKVIQEGSGVELAGHTLLMARNGAQIPIDDSAAPIKDENNKIVGVVLVFRDITQRRQAEEERTRLLAREQTARAEAELANQTKDEFLATVSHELRSPLNSILGWARLLRAGDLDPATSARALETIERNGRLQAQIVDDLLDVSRIIMGKLQLDVRPIELPPVVHAALDSVRPAAAAKGIRLATEFDPVAGLISGDPNRLQQIIWNLLSNAIRFTPKDGRVTVRLIRAGSNVQIQVNDTGKGISAEFLPFVFDRFRQADSGSTRRSGGLGLGLSIVRHLVEMHGGTIQAESSGEGQGSTFTVNFPLLAIRRFPEHVPEIDAGQAHLAGDQKSGSGDGPRALAGLCALVVEDQADARELLTRVLQNSGATVKAVPSAAEALAVLEPLQPDILISDIGMPNEDGYALIRRVRALEADRGGQLPAVALTAYASEADRKQALAAGFQMHLPKPVEPAELVTAVASLAKREKKLNW